MDTTATSGPLIKAARVLYHRGDDGGEPRNRNGEGFNRSDYAAAGAILRRVDAGIASPTDEWALARILAKYRRQLGELGIDLDALDAVDAATWATLRGDEPVAPVPRPVETIGRATTDAARGVEATPDGPPITLPPMGAILGPGGLIAAKLPGYEARPSQVALAQRIADAIVARESLLAEAGTGVGKSLAYLIPAILSRQKTIVSTEGKALQDQIAKKDAPFLAAVLPDPFRFAILKGFANYVCRARIGEERGDEMLTGATYEWREHADALESWLDTTETGDLAELPFPASPEFRARLSVGSDECDGKDCPFHDDCFPLAARRRAEEADVVVVNHTLLSLDIALRDRTHDGIKILPDRRLIVVDECHALRDVATDAFTLEITNWSVSRLLRGRLPALARLDPAQLALAEDANRRFWAHFERDERPSRVVTPTQDLADLAVAVRAALLALKERINVAAENTEGERDRRRLGRYADRLGTLADTFTDILATGEDHVLYVERGETRRGYATLTLKRAPISVAEDLRRALWAKWPVIATSATIATASGFAYFRESAGCDDAREIVVGSPFDYPRNALLYLPRDGSAFDPSRFYQDGSVDYFDRLGREIEDLLLASDGRAFCLFTSRRALDEVYRRIAHRLRWNMLRQGDYGTQETIRRFKADGHAVLFGLRSFFTGVDVQGEALSLVVIDKLSFSPPDDPVGKARQEAITQATGDRWAWFTRLAIPEATILLKQATGRLIRSTTDRGVVALMDGRLTMKSYGTGILRSLPPMPRTRSLDAVRAFFAGGASPRLDDAHTTQGGLL